MKYAHKTKTNYTPIIVGIIAAIILVGFSGIVRTNFGDELANRYFGFYWIAFAIIQFVFWVPTKNPGYFTFMLFSIAVSISYLTDYKGGYFVVPAVLLLALYLYFIASKQLRWRFVDILELAAQPIESAEDGFTPRPYPVGKISFDKNIFEKFGKFLSKNLIAFPVAKNDCFYLLIKGSNGFWFSNPKVSKDSFIAFDSVGNVSVNLTRKDYNNFKDELTFDQLCRSLAELFIEFWEFYKNGDKYKIIDRLNNFKKYDLSRETN